MLLAEKHRLVHRAGLTIYLWVWALRLKDVRAQVDAVLSFLFNSVAAL